MDEYILMMPKAQLESFKENHPNGMSMAEGLRYDHPAFPEQLNAGLRNLEIDVYYDPTGNRFNDPAAYCFSGKKELLISYRLTPKVRMRWDLKCCTSPISISEYINRH